MVASQWTYDIMASTNRTTSLLDLPPLNRLQEIDVRRKDFPTTSTEYGWFYENKDAMWKFHPWTQMSNVVSPPSYYKASYGSQAQPEPIHSDGYYRSEPRKQPGYLTDRPAAPVAAAVSVAPDTYSRNLNTYRAQYKPPADSQNAYLNDLKSIELTTRDNRKLRFDLSDRSQPPASSRF